MAAGKTGGAAAAHAGRNGNSRSGAGCASAAVRGDGPAGARRGIGLGRNNHRRRLDFWRRGISSPPAGRYCPLTNSLLPPMSLVESGSVAIPSVGEMRGTETVLLADGE